VIVRRTAAVAGLGILVLAAAPIAGAEPPEGSDSIDAYPIAQGNYTTPQDFYYVYFKTPDGRSCGIGPNVGPVGCDAVPMDAPTGTNQTVVNSWGGSRIGAQAVASAIRAP
jgi:hypothetical protein